MNDKIGSNSRSSSDFGGAGKWLKHPNRLEITKENKKEEIFLKKVLTKK